MNFFHLLFLTLASWCSRAVTYRSETRHVGFSRTPEGFTTTLIPDWSIDDYRRGMDARPPHGLASAEAADFIDYASAPGPIDPLAALGAPARRTEKERPEPRPEALP